MAVFWVTDFYHIALILWPPDAKKWLIWKDPDAGKDWRWEEKGTTEDEMVGWHHRINGHEFEQAPGVDDGQGGLACCSPWGRKESDTTEQLNWTDWTDHVIWQLRNQRKKSESHSVASDFVNSLGQNISVGSLSLLQGIFSTQESNWVFCITGGFPINWAIRKAHLWGKLNSDRSN